MKQQLLMLSLLVSVAASAQVTIGNRQPAARTNFGVQKLRTAISQSRLNTAKHAIILEKKSQRKKKKVLPLKQKTIVIRLKILSTV